MSVLNRISTEGHENVTIVQNHATGLLAIIAVHDNTLGPALGGCRMIQYESLDDALADVLGLSQGMTYKNSLAGLNLGGGKSVIIADRDIKEGRAELFESFGEAIQKLGGIYITAEDMGTSVEDMSCVTKTCDHVAGRDPAVGGGGDPSPYTAKGCFGGIQACLERAHGSKDLNGRHVAIQGVGHVGFYLGQLLVEAGATITVCDPRSDALDVATSELGAKVVELDDIYTVDCDIFAPCAMGGIINPDTVGTLNCKIVAGAANVQIEGEGTEQALIERGIMYAPDFAINSGGVILCADEYEPGGFTELRVLERVSRIYGTVGKVLDESKASGDLPGTVAVRLAKARIEKARAEKAAG